MSTLETPFHPRLTLCFLALSTLAAPDVRGQLSGWYQSLPGTQAFYEYQYGSNFLPVNISLHFSGSDSTSTLTATILTPIIGAQSNGTPIYPIALYFPMRVTATSQNGRDFHGSFFGQYLFDWRFEPSQSGQLVLNGNVGWAGGRYELTTITQAPFEPALAGDYNQDGSVDAADYAHWREMAGTADTLPNDPTGGTIGIPQYETWRAGFGSEVASGVLSSSAGIPEPSIALLIVLGLLHLAFQRPLWLKTSRRPA